MSARPRARLDCARILPVTLSRLYLTKKWVRRQVGRVRDYDRAEEIGGELHARLTDIRFPLDPSIEREIQRIVYSYADELKVLGLPPERVIVALKRVANEAGVYSTSRIVPSASQLEGKDKLLVDIVGWCIERYYSRPRRSDARPPIDRTQEEAR